MFAKLLLWLVLAFGCSAIIRILLSLDMNKSVYNHVPGPCVLVDGVEHGSEDMELLADGTVIITSGLVYARPQDRDTIKGALYMYQMTEEPVDPRSKKPVATKLTFETTSTGFDPKNFWPHGLSSYTSKGKTILYVVNHGRFGDSVETFTFNKEKRSVTHLKTIIDPLIYAANDLVVVGADKFFLTNDHFFKQMYVRLFVEDILHIALGNIVLYDGHQAKSIDSWLPSPNGIAVSPKNDYLYVSFIRTELIRIYKLEKDLAITKKSEMSLMTMADNIFVEPSTGHLWVGAHPVMHQIAQHLFDPQVKAPSQVLRIRIQDGHESWVVTEPYVDNGDLLRGSSVAVYKKNQLLIGTVQHRLMMCYVVNEDLA